jgi:hypothetical protein
VDAAQEYKEDRSWNGSNWISVATGSQWEHECLYRTRSGAWVLCHWSQWQGSTTTYALVSADEATRWLIRNGHEVAEAAAAALEV